MWNAIGLNSDRDCYYQGISEVCLEYCLCAQTVLTPFLTNKQLPYLSGILLNWLWWDGQRKSDWISLSVHTLQKWQEDANTGDCCAKPGGTDWDAGLQRWISCAQSVWFPLLPRTLGTDFFVLCILTKRIYANVKSIKTISHTAWLNKCIWIWHQYRSYFTGCGNHFKNIAMSHFITLCTSLLCLFFNKNFTVVDIRTHSLAILIVAVTVQDKGKYKPARYICVWKAA